MRSLLTSGVNIFPSNNSHKYVDLPDKSRTVEDQMCVHLAMLSGVFAFSWSKWSASPTLSRRQFVMRAAEWADQGGAGTEQEPAWFLMVGGDRSFKLALTEKDEEFSDELRADCEVHPDVYSCVVEGCPLETKERLSTMTSPVHVDNVTQWLQTTRVLSYS